MKPLPSRASRKPASSPHLLPGRLRRRSTRVLPSRNTKGDKPAPAKKPVPRPVPHLRCWPFLCKVIGAPRSYRRSGVSRAGSAPARKCTYTFGTESSSATIFSSARPRSLTSLCHRRNRNSA
jgi:hypothetical protein